MKKLLLGVAALVIALPQLRADEGMWLPMFIKRLNFADMQKHGLQLTADEIYSVNNNSLKDAIVQLNGGSCTAEIISGQGLVLTNHHCAYGSIQSHSSTDHDYLTDGFWAKTLNDELPNEGFSAALLVRMEDVTNKVLGELTDDMSEADRAKKIQEISQKLAAEAQEGNGYKAQVKSFFYGNEFYMFVYEVFEDIRLVGAPPSSVGKYGGDTDNWMWPRHTGDFSLMRIYAGKDNKPAKYSTDNIPFTPRHHLPVSIAGVEDGDYAMIMGYPGSTDRYLTSFGIEEELEYHQPTVVEIREKKLEIMRKYMNADDAVRIAYASKYAQVANYWKYYIGQQKQLKRNKVKAQKEALEADFTKWVNADPKRKAKYGDALKMIEDGVAETSKTSVGNTYMFEAGLLGPEIVLFAFRNGRLIDAGLEDASLMESNKPKILAAADKHFKDSHLPLDRDMMEAMLKMYKSKVPADQQPAFFKVIDDKFKGDISKFVDEIYSSSIYTSKERLTAFLEKPSKKKLDKDYGRMVANDFIQMYFANQAAGGTTQENIDKGYRLFVDGIRKMNSNKSYYPNANSTMRLTYGNVGSYNAADAVHYNYYTTLDGVMEKEDPSNDEFIVPSKLKDLHAKKDYGRYANAEGGLTVNFITNNDITGGNSGSPVINAKGELIGCAFDGNWEAMSGDIAFEPNVQRTICVDARYILFIIDKFAGATRLIDEMDIVTTPVNATTAADKVDAELQGSLN